MKMITSPGELRALINQSLALVDFGVPWCASSCLQEPIMRRLADQFGSKVSLAIVNVDQLPDIALRMGVRSVPTLVIFQNGREVRRYIGLHSAQTLGDALNEISGETSTPGGRQTPTQ